MGGQICTEMEINPSKRCPLQLGTEEQLLVNAVYRNVLFNNAKLALMKGKIIAKDPEIAGILHEFFAEDLWKIYTCL